MLSKCLQPSAQVLHDKDFSNNSVGDAVFWFPSARVFVSRGAKIAFFERAIFDQFWCSTLVKDWYLFVCCAGHHFVWQQSTIKWDDQKRFFAAVLLKGNGESAGDFVDVACDFMDVLPCVVVQFTEQRVFNLQGQLCTKV